jgi:hypothetical protein
MSVVLQLKMIIYGSLVVLLCCILLVLYLLVKLSEISDNLQSSFIMFSEDLADLAEVLRAYHDRLDY